MPWNTGVFSRSYNWVADRDAGTKIRADRMDAEFDNYKDALNSLTAGSVQFLGGIRGYDGTVSLPGYSFSGDLNTGIYRIGADNIGVAVGGAKILDISSTGVLLNGSAVAVVLNNGLLSGFRNKIINGDFDIWQRATSQTSSGYGSDDRWFNQHVGSTKTASQQTFALGQTAVPGNPTYYSRTVVSSVAAAGNFCAKLQKIEGVKTLAGKTATVTFWAKADATKNIAGEMNQFFGTGGAPSTSVSIPAGLQALTTSWQKFTFTVAIPSISGKTLGSTGDALFLVLWLDAGTTYNSRSTNLGQQSGTFDIAHVSLVEGDATAETDPFSPRHIQQELALCQRYYEKSYPLETALGSTSTTGATSVRIGGLTSATNTGNFSIPFKISKRAAPTVVAYAPTTGTSGSVHDNTNAADAAATLSLQSETGFNITAASTSATSSWWMRAHWTADAEL